MMYSGMLTTDQHGKCLPDRYCLSNYFVAWSQVNSDSSVFLHLVFQSRCLNYLIDFKSKFLVNSLCVLVESENRKGNAFNTVILKDEVYESLQCLCPQARPCFPGIYDKPANVYVVLVNSYFLYHSDKFPPVEYRKHILQFFYFAIIQRVRDIGAVHCSWNASPCSLDHSHKSKALSFLIPFSILISVILPKTLLMLQRYINYLEHGTGCALLSSGLCRCFCLSICVATRRRFFSVSMQRKCCRKCLFTDF